MSRRLGGRSILAEVRPIPRAARGSEKTRRAALRESLRAKFLGGVGVDFSDEGPSESNSCSENDRLGTFSTD